MQSVPALMFQMLDLFTTNLARKIEMQITGS